MIGGESDGARATRRERWDTLAFIAAAGGLAVLFVWVGYRLAKGLSLFPSGSVARLPASTVAGLSDTPGDDVDDFEKEPLVMPATRTVSVSTTPVLLVPRSPPLLRNVARQATIGTDQPIRIGSESDISGSQGVYVAASSLPFNLSDIPPDLALYGVRAGPLDATVGILIQTLHRKG